MTIGLCNKFDKRVELNNENNNLFIKNLPKSKCEKSVIISNLGSTESIDEFLSNFDTILYDCDGFLRCDANNNTRDTHTVQKVVENLRKWGKKLIFTTNKSDETRQQMLIKLNKSGFGATIDELFPTSYTTAVYLKAINFDRKVFVVGSNAIAEELYNKRIQTTGMSSFHSKPVDMSPGFASFKLDPNVGAVVVTFDNTIPFPTLVKACSYATNPDCLFIVANTELNNSTQDQSPPEVQVSAIQVVCNKGYISVAKPNKLYFHCIRQMHSDIDTNRCLIITDRLTTDIRFGKNNGIKTLFLETEDNREEYINKTMNSERPDYFTDIKSFLTLDDYI